ncbi:MAG: outer membrane lipoprotein chaperone LolA [Zoogloea oleivorans]|jgi:outer membrane lipoprotein carrier protein|uniref:Outer-membrane lipoprotein carrier protein n=2 Tax=Zoogloeaceae TaxID=2008794 RepID=A0A6C2D0D6_9RHOO|nr:MULTISPECIES: outer membrane lipoprotein chaperone LolA [Zoogloea]MBT9497403.1 outer membrane lipoprotein chaperone LolA [Zoogloea sp.]MDD2668320.1 outer membrane lipoprotein chaperone LolA [Zoogloea sp.]MDY0036504.1 outer membrane lipoprotein chaperone LolA [Zoogloea oleivorans]TYC59890.1 outer membrane lipoprotein chaperone LolA [Zoogloea oleivorans]
MMFRTPTLRALGLALLFAAGSVHADGLAQLKQFMDGTRTARGSFTQQVFSKSGRKPQPASGTFAFSRPGKFRWIYEKPYAQLLVGDGSKLWAYDQELNQVTTKKLGQALGSTPAAILAGDNSLDRNFVLKNAGDADGLEWIEATPKAEDSSFERIRMGFAGGQLKAMLLNDNFGQTTSLLFGQIERNPSLDAGLFRFTPPKGADVVGE